MPTPQDYILEYASSLPKSIQDLLLSADLGDKLQKIGERNNLHLDQLDALFAEMGAVLMGLTHPRDFSGKIARVLGIGVDAAAKITADVNREILSPIREELENLHENLEAQKEKPETREEEEMNHISRESLIAEIENPLPVGFRPVRTIAPENIAPTKTEMVVNLGSPAKELPMPTPEAPENPTPETPNKMTAPSISLNKEIVVTPETLKDGPRHPDPYREPIE